jgi:hypothetical protein
MLQQLFSFESKLKAFVDSGCNSPSAFYVGSSVTTIAANTANIVFDAPVITTVCSPYNVTARL